MKTVVYVLAIFGIIIIDDHFVYAGTDQTGNQRIIGYRINAIYPDSSFTFADSANYSYSAHIGDTGVYNELYDTFNIIDQYSGNLFVGDKHIITRDANGNMLEYLEKTWNGVQLKDRYRRVYTYDNHGHVTRDLRQTFFQNAWRDDGIVVYEYDAQSRVIARTDSARLIGVWQITGKYLTGYDNAGNISQQISLEDSNGVWDTLSVTTYMYNANNQILTMLTQGVVDDTLLSVMQRTSTYDSNGNLLTWFQELSTNGGVTNQRRFSYTYNAGNQKTTELSQEGIALDSVYYLEWTYDVNDNLISYSVYNWDSGIRRPYTRKLYNYSTNDLLTEITFQGWDSLAWTTGGMYTFTYDANGFLDLFTDQRMVSGNWENYKQEDYNCNTHGNIEYILKKDWKSGTWENKYEEFRYYEDYDAATALFVIPAAPTLALYPNPAANSLFFDFNTTNINPVTVDIYNSTGQKVSSAGFRTYVGNNHLQLDVALLNSGLYLVEARQGAQVSRAKFVRQ